MALVQSYCDPKFTEWLGLHGQMMVSAAFARFQFLQIGENTREFAGKTWTESGHDLDYIFQRDGVNYGVEVKNTLGYMDRNEFLLKIRLCHHLGLRPVFAVRMIPKTGFMSS